MNLRAAQGLWRRAPEPLRRLSAPLIRGGIEAYVRATSRRSSSAPWAGQPVQVVGYFSQPHGIGASARLAVRAFEACGIDVRRVDVSGDSQGLNLSVRLDQPTSAAAWIFYMNPPEMIAAMGQLGPRRLIGPRYACWAWELPRAPARWLSDAGLVDEVWAPSRYTAQALAGARAAVRVVPHPLFLEDYSGVRPAPRTAAFQAVSLFDFNSSAARKNPNGTIAAFVRAFGDDPNVELTLKTQNGARFPRQLAALRAAASPRVRIIDEVWPYARIKALIAGADVLISLHRAEGFGLTPAEAMALGVPVLATAWSGNLDFMDEASALLVPARQIPVVDPQQIYRGQTWADPDLEAAAQGLRRLRDEPALRAQLGEAGRRRVAQLLSPRAWLDALPDTLRIAAGRAGQASTPSWAHRRSPATPR